MATHRRHRDEDLDSEFEYAAEKKRKTWTDDPLAFQKPDHASSTASHHSAQVPSKQLVSCERDREEWRARRFHLLSMDAYSRHKALVNQYILSSGRGIEHFVRSTDKDKNDYSVLREQHKFLWSERDDVSSWEKRLAKVYYDKLFKEYAIGDLSRYKENQYAMRWRTENEVVEGKGQFMCGNKRCSERDELQSWEVNFGYVEHEEKKNALVKLRLCSECSKKLNYHHKRKPWKRGGRPEASGSSGKSVKKHSKHKKKDKKHRHKHRHTKTKEGEEKEQQYEWKEKSSAQETASSDSDESGSSSGEEGEAKRKSKASAIWSKPAEAFLDKSKEEEFDDYFTDMLL